MTNIVSNKDRGEIFSEELNRIYDERIREFTRLCLCTAPNYFFTDCPASTSGKYHPISELGPDGTMIHTKKVFTVAYELCRGMGCEDRRDEILASCIIHDLRKQGLARSGHTVRNHPDLAAQLVEEVQENTMILENDSFKIIRDCVGYHYGLWGSGKWVKPLSEFTPMEMCVYLSDYIASKRCIEVDYRR